MSMILLFYCDAGRRYPDATCFIFEIFLLVESEMLLCIKASPFFSVELSAPVSVSTA